MFTILKGILNQFIKIIYSLAANWFYLILAFIVPLTIYYVGQGEEIVRELIPPDQPHRINYLVYWNLFFVLVSFLVLFYAVWVIPVSSIHLVFRLLKGSKRCENLPEKWNAFKLLAVTYNTRKDGHALIPIRILANIPLYIFNYLLIVINWNDGRGFIYFFLFLVFSLLISEWIKEYMGKLEKRKQFLFGLNISTGKPFFGYLVHFTLVCLVLLFWKQEPCYYLSILFLWMLCIWNDVFHKFIEMLSAKEQGHFNCKDDILKKSWNVYLVHWIVVLVFLGVMVYLHSFYQLNQLSAIVVMNVVFALFILLMDLLIKTPLELFYFLSKVVHPSKSMDAKIKPDQETGEEQKHVEEQEIEVEAMIIELQQELGSGPNSIKSKSERNTGGAPKEGKFDHYYWVFRVLNLSITILLIYVIFISSANDHKMRREAIGLDEFKLYNERESLEHYYSEWKKHNGYPDTVILIAALGGGSRAGYYTGLHLDNIYNSTLDSITRSKIFAISSISGGSNGANMFIAKAGMEILGFSPDSSNHEKFWRKVYGFNYVSSALWGLLLNDGIMGWIDKNSVFDKDRNYTRQQEELRTFSSNYSKPEAFESARLFFDRDYMVRYSKSELKYKLPIHLINTAKVQNGMRAVIAPFQLDTNYFHNCVDLYQRHLENQTKCCKLSFSAATAVMLSQSFPLVAAYNYLECVGTFMDGGHWENSGLHTISELYQNLKRIDSSQRFKIIYISNSDSDNESTAKVNSVVLQTMQTVSTAPFSGHTLYWERAISSMCHKDSIPFKHIRLADSSGKEVKIPLGILLSQKSMDTMYHYFKINVP
ncbi:MAG: hypothetical protein IPM48_08825 [Saprospiraceae bacterium]|nr:hypothetical protein [Saprospiraceae bacterium]